MKIIAVHNDHIKKQKPEKSMVAFVTNVVQSLFLKGLKLVFQDVLIQNLNIVLLCVLIVRTL